MLKAALRPAFVAATVVWALLLPLVPFLAGRPHATSIGAAVIVAVYAIGSMICHQLPERSFHLWAAQLPVCARCTGIYAGAAMTAILVSSAPLKRRPTYSGGREEGGSAVGRRLSGAFSPRGSLFIALLPTLATLASEWTTGHMPAHWIRAASGAPLGATVVWLVLSSMPRRARADNQVN